MRLFAWVAVLLCSASALGAETGRFMGTLAERRGGEALIEDNGRTLRLDGLDPRFLQRHTGHRAVVYGSLSQPAGMGAEMILFADKIVITTPAERTRMDSYTPPHTAGERSADALKQIAPLLF